MTLLAQARVAPPPAAQPPVPPQPPESAHRTTSKSSVNWRWSQNGRTAEVRADGNIEFTDDDADVKYYSAKAMASVYSG